MNKSIASVMLTASIALLVGVGCSDDDSSSGTGAAVVDTDANSGGSDTGASLSNTGSSNVSGDTGLTPSDTGGVAMDTSAQVDSTQADSAPPEPDTSPPPDDTDTIAMDTGAPDTSPADTAIEPDVEPDVEPDAPEVDPEVCREVCQNREDNADMQGFCTMEGYLNFAACEALCLAQSAEWGDTEVAAFRTCAETDPLCFQTVDQCMVGELYADELASETPVSQMAEIRGTGFEALEGRLVFAELSYGFSQVVQAAQARVRDGGFTLEWTFARPLEFSRADVGVLLYVDAVENVVCEPEADLTFGTSARPQFGTSPLFYLLELTPDDAVTGFQAETVCDTFR